MSSGHSSLRFPALAAVLAATAAFTGAAAAQSSADTFLFQSWVGVTGEYGTVDGAAEFARFRGPDSLAVDAVGNIYVADYSNNSIRKITPAGRVTTLAGVSGEWGSRDGLGSAARFSFPSGIALDSQGNLYVADQGNNTIRKITPDGYVSTLAGQAGLWGRVDAQGAEARFMSPNGVAVDRAGNVFVADSSNNAIRKITPAGMVTTFAGSGDYYGFGWTDGPGAAARFHYPADIAIDAADNLYVADTRNCTIRKITPAGVVTTLAGLAGIFGTQDGTGGVARFGGQNAQGDVYGPPGLGLDALGNVYVADSLNHTVRKITPAGVVTTVGGMGGMSGSADGLASAARFYAPVDVAVDHRGALYVSESYNYVVRKGTLVDPLSVVPVFTLQPRHQAASAGADVALIVNATAASTPAMQWLRNGQPIDGANGFGYVIGNLQPAKAGIYAAQATLGGETSTSNSAIVGLLPSAKIVGAAEEVGSNIYVQANKNTFDQVLLQGAAATITADEAEKQITRISFIDVDNDIVQVEFSGPGTLTVVLDNPSGPATPVNYDQAVTYMKGNAGIVIAGATAQTHVAVFSVGRITAVNQALFKPEVSYGGMANIAFIAISSADGKFGGVRTANAHYLSTKGLTGVYAPNVEFTGPVFVGDITAAENATGVLMLAGAARLGITGGDLWQANGRPIQTVGVTTLEFIDGTDSHGKLVPGQDNRAVLLEAGEDITDQVTVRAP